MIAVPRPPSIRTRLALIYTGLLAGALLVFGVGVYLVLHAQLDRTFDADLVANAHHAAGAFAQDVDPQGLLQPSARLVAELAATGGRVVVLAPDGTVLADSAGGAPPLPITSSDLATARSDAHAVRELTVATTQRRLAVEAIRSPGGSLLGYVAWAQSTASIHDLLATVALALVLGGLLLTGLAFIGGVVLAGRALGPVAEVTGTARAISLSGDFGARVEEAQRRDEVGELAIAFNEMLTSLEENHQALQRFLGDASHQLRTPLTTILANLDLARRPDLPPEERAAILADARDEAERMGRLVRDLLALARAESGARLEFGRVELDALLVESVRTQRQAAGHVTMRVRAVEPVVVAGDRDRLVDLLAILLDNAARYTPAGGRVAASLRVEDHQAVVRIEDTGIGISEADRGRLFERLYRGARARKLRPAGTGLGLAIARWIVEAHGGAITLANRAESGTVATVRLPVLEGRPPQAGSGSPSDGRVQKGSSTSGQVQPSQQL